jgi:hypothetical protein
MRKVIGAMVALTVLAGTTSLASASPLVRFDHAASGPSDVVLAKNKGNHWKHHGWSRGHHYGWSRGKHKGWHKHGRHHRGGYRLY